MSGREIPFLAKIDDMMGTYRQTTFSLSAPCNFRFRCGHGALDTTALIKKLLECKHIWEVCLSSLNGDLACLADFVRESEEVGI